MVNPVFSTTPVIGVGFDRKTQTQEHQLGMIVNLGSTDANQKGRYAMYVHASVAIAANGFVTIDMTTIDCTATSVDGGSGTALCRNGSVAFTAGDFGWVAGINRGKFF